VAIQDESHRGFLLSNNPAAVSEGGTGATTAAAALTALGALAKAGDTMSGLLTLGAGSDTAPSAPVLTALGAASGTAEQLSDLTRDYMVYLDVTTAGTATTVSMGHTSGASDVTILNNVAVAIGQLIAFRLPAGWWFKWAGTTTAIGNQVAVGC
jgi:hypothetical protein